MVARIIRRIFFLLPLLTLATMTNAGGASSARAATDAEIINGFNLTVFGAEYSPFG